MDHFLEKYQSLNPTTRQEVNDFVDFFTQSTEKEVVRPSQVEKKDFENFYLDR
ncbi:MAG: hypothetical protein ACK5OO_02300 [Cyclobacteriaceae bacterium]